MIKYNNNSKFMLNQNSVEAVLKIVQNKNKDVTFTIETSPNTFSKSIYVRIHYNNFTTSLRISDHDTYYTKQGGGIASIVVGKTTKVSTICNRLQREVQNVYYKNKAENLKNKFKEIENVNYRMQQ